MLSDNAAVSIMVIISPRGVHYGDYRRRRHDPIIFLEREKIHEEDTRRVISFSPSVRFRLAFLMNSD